MEVNNIAGVRGSLPKRANKISFDDEVTRGTLITRQDVCNIIRRVHHVLHHRHHDDAISDDRMVAELEAEPPSPIIGYKAQGIQHVKYPSLPDESFILFLMTDFQASTLLKMGSTSNYEE